MQFGAPTMASNATSMPEVTGEAAILISPTNPDAWTYNMLELASNAERRRGLGAAARQQVQRFNWENSARSVLRIYQEAINLPKRRETNSLPLSRTQFGERRLEPIQLVSRTR